VVGIRGGGVRPCTYVIVWAGMGGGGKVGHVGVAGIRGIRGIFGDTEPTKIY